MLTSQFHSRTGIPISQIRKVGSAGQFYARTGIPLYTVGLE
jgi:hypothetical protein